MTVLWWNKEGLENEDQTTEQLKDIWRKAVNRWAGK
jgi:hypothetical protein